MADTDPREQALRLLDLVTTEGRLLAEVMPRQLQGLTGAESARAGRLATDTLRHMGRADRILGPYLKKRPTETALNLLRMAVVELCQGGAAHGVVHAAVALTRKSKSTERMSGLVNAVLRRVSEEAPAKWETMAASELPKWLRKPLIATYGKARVAAMEAAHAQVPPLDLTPKSGDAAALAAQVGGTVLSTGSVRLTGSVQVTALPGYEAGDWWVQDAAAALPARLLAVQPGERVLDLCAAPGGKTMQMAAAGAEVTALDISADRMKRVAENLSRTGLQAKIVVADALTYEAAPFDAILLDAPCSATGTIRRHPDLPHAKKDSDFSGLLTLQAAMIDRALALLKPGGRLVFCTCSLFPEEGEMQAEAALARHPGLVPDAQALGAVPVEEGWSIGASGLRLTPDMWPETGGLDGFFMAAFRKAT